MKRRKKTPSISTKCVKTSKEISCGSETLKGAARSDQLLVTGLVVLIVISAVTIGSVLVSWKKQKMGEKRCSRDANIENLQAQVDSLRKEIAKNKAASNLTVDSQKQLSNQNVQKDFEQAVSGKNFAGIEALMAARVYYVVDASDCCGDITRKEAVAHLKNYIRDVKSFNFDQNQQVVKQMKVNLADTFAEYTIGIADNRMVLSYHLDGQGKVDDLMLSASHLMYDLE